MELNKLKKIKGNKSKAKRVGKGIGSGKGGHTVGKGMKGQKSRSGNNIPFGFEGGQVPLYKKLPQIGGFKNPNPTKTVSVTLKSLNKISAKTVTPQTLVDENILKSIPRDGVKLIGNTKVDKKLTLEGFLISTGAREALEKAGCTIKE